MANKKQNEELIQQAYQKVASELGLNDKQTINEKVHAIILEANDLQTDICLKADSIKITAYEQVNSTWPELGISNPIWLELVNLRRLQRHTELSDEFIAKVAATFDGAKNATALRMSMLDAIKTNTLDHLQVPTCDSEKDLEFTPSTELAPEFIELLNECAATRHEMDSKLWVRMRLLGDAFTYVTKEPYKVFKHLLDLYHYRNGGWPKASTPPRVWSAIFRFVQTYDLLQQYGFDMAKHWCKRMGIETVRTLPSPTMHTFTEAAEVFGQYFMAKLKDDMAAKYPMYEFRPWLHLIVSGNVGFAYVWDSREIKFTFDPHVIDMQDFNVDYTDPCKPLWTDDAAINKLALEHIPNVMRQNWHIRDVDEASEPQPAKPKQEPRTPVDFGTKFDEVKSKIKQRLLDKVPSEAGKAFIEEVIGSDFLERYNWLKEHPEYNYDENYAAQWKRGDECDHIALGRGYIDGADESTGELLVHFYQHDKVYPVWMWHLAKVEQNEAN
jgi:hypothetical protein